MGNADIRQLAAIESIDVEEVDDSVVAIDAHNWLYRYLTTVVRFTSDDAYTTAAGEAVPNLIGAVQGVAKLLEADFTPVFVFDGHVTELKDDEIEKRREAREQREAELEKAREAGDAVAVARLESQTQQLTPTILETTRELFDRLDVPVVDAPAEGEAQAAHMNRAGDVDFVGTEDYDALLLGAPLTLRQLTSSGDPELMDFEATLADLDLDWEQLVDAALLMGTDFNDGVAGVGPKTAVSLVREHDTLAAALDARDAEIPQADRIKALFMDPDVTDDYAFDEGIEPDMDATRAYVCDEWEVDASELERSFERIEAAVVQTGLDNWS